MPATQPAEAKLYEALMKAQAEFPAIKKTKTATVKTQKGTYKYKYADLGDIIDEVTPVLVKHGLVVCQPIDGDNLITVLAHPASGATITSSVRIGQNPADSQAVGSALTYMRRYSLTALLGIATEDDTDAQNVPKAAPPREVPAPTRTEPETLLDHEFAEAIAGKASDLDLLDRLPLAVAHIRGGRMMPEFNTPQELVTALQVLTLSEGERVHGWLDKKAAEQAGQTEMAV